jgi:aldehyde dehydrogenase (NAD+)
MTNRFQPLFDVHREHFLSDATKSHDWRVDQLDRMERMLADNKDAWCAALYQDLGKPRFKQLFEITVPSGVIRYYRENLRELMAPRPTPIPAGLEATGNSSVIYKEPYGVTLVIYHNRLRLDGVAARH